MNFSNLVCNNCENEKEDSFLFFEEKESKELIKNKNTNINIKSLLSSSDNNNSTNNILEIIEYPYIYNCNDNEDDNCEPTPGIDEGENFKKNDNNINEPQYREPQYKEPQYKEPQYKEPQYKEPQYREPQYREPQYREPLYKEPQYKEPQYKEKIVYEEPKIYNQCIENNNKMARNKEENNVSHNNIQNSKESSSLINAEDTVLQNKVLLTDYYSNMNNKILNTESTHENNILNTSVDKKEDINSNTIQNIYEIKVEYPNPDSNIVNQKKNINFIKEVKNSTHRKEEIESIKAIKVKRKTFNDKKIIKKTINNRNRANKDKKVNLNTNSIVMNAKNKNFKYCKKNINLNKNKNKDIRKKLLNVNTEKIIVRKKLTERKLSSRTNELIFSYNNIDKSSFSTNNLKKSEQSLINLSKNRVRYLSHTYFGKLLLNNSTNRNTLSNLKEKKMNSNLNSSENLKCSSLYSLNSSKTYINPFAQLYDRKKRNFLY